MALALDCVCLDSGAYTCQITKLYWVIEAARSDLPWCQLSLLGGPFDVTIGQGGYAFEPQEIDLGDPTQWLALWDSLYFHFTAVRTTASDDMASGYARFYLRSVWNCTDGASGQSGQEQRARNTVSASDICSNDGVTIDAAGSIGMGAATGYISHTRPLRDCNGFTVDSGTIRPKPKNLQTVDLGSSPASSLHLCPSGGTGPYVYAIVSGNLPGGMELNPSTGYITGTPDGSRLGSEEIVFSVFDSTYAYAEVTCSMIQSCAITTDYGNSFY